MNLYQAQHMALVHDPTEDPTEDVFAGEPMPMYMVEMKQLRFGYFPKAFTMKGVEYEVQEVVKCWTVVEQMQLWFRVRCGENVLDLYRDVKTNTWTLVD